MSVVALTVGIIVIMGAPVAGLSKYPEKAITIKILRQEGLPSPIHYMLADPQNLVLLEVYSPERFDVRKISNGVLAYKFIHTKKRILSKINERSLDNDL